MRIATYNIQYGLGSDGNYDLARIASEVADADIIGLQEVDRFWKRSGMVDSPAVLADHLPQHHFVYGANLDMNADLIGAERINHRRKQFGTMILSRYPILSSRNFPLPKWGDRTHHSIQQGILEAVIDAPTGPLRAYSVHLSHLSPSTRLPQIEAMKAILSRAPEEGGAWCGGHPEPESGWIEEEEPPMPDDVVVMGDFNFRPDSAEYEAVVGTFAPPFGRLTNRRGLVDSWVAAGHDEMSGTTHPAQPTRIDYIFVSAGLAPAVVSSEINDRALGSDHFPVFLDIFRDNMKGA